MAIFILGPDPDGNCCGCDGRTSPCDTCGGPATCPCALVLPPFGLSPDPTYADAVTRAAVVADCICYAPGSVPASAVTASNATANQIDLDADYTTTVDPTDSLTISMYNTITVAEGAVLTVAWNIPSRRNNGSNSFFIYPCDYTLLTPPIESHTITTNTGSQAMTALPAGTYVIISNGESALGEDHFQASFTITSSTTMVVSPAYCRWEDGADVRILDACPKMLLPPLTENTGTWYASEAAAQAVLDDPLQVSNCIGYSEGGPGLTAFTATSTVSSLTLATQDVAGVFTWASLNLEDGATLTLTGTVSAGTASITAWIYDYTGTLIEQSGTSIASPWTSAALPYTGRYIVKVVTESTVATANASSVLTSSGTMSVNQIQALWDAGVDCPAHLDC